MTKVLHIQHSIDSAGSAALRLHRAFLKSGIDSSILSFQYVKTSDKRIACLGGMANRIGGWDQKIQAFIRKDILPSYGLFSYPILGTDISQLPEVRNADIIYLHWVLHGFLNLHDIEKLAKLGKPIIFFMHDMWTVTGGCHHSFECVKYQTKCFDCPMFERKTIKDWASSEFEKKSKLFSAYNNLYFVSPSKWLYNCAKKSGLTKQKPIFYIPNILDNTLFKPFDKKVAKGILNIDPGQTVIAFGAVTITSPYKGMKYLQEALNLLKLDLGKEKTTLLIFGSDYNKEIADAFPFNVKFVGYLKDEYSTSLIYNAADIFVAPSIAETFGYTVFEALSCGTPVVAFNTGGIPDLITHQVNGYLARYKDAQDLAEGIKFTLNNKIKGHFSADFEAENTVNKHKQLFAQIN